jgi:hypothetical protein
MRCFGVKIDIISPKTHWDKSRTSNPSVESSNLSGGTEAFKILKIVKMEEIEYYFANPRQKKTRLRADLLLKVDPIGSFTSFSYFPMILGTSICLNILFGVV